MRGKANMMRHESGGIEWLLVVERLLQLLQGVGGVVGNDGR